MRTGRPKQPLAITDEEREWLESLAHRARSQPLLARRARVVLGCAEGLDNRSVARKLRCSVGMVGKWRARFLKQRLQGLYDEPRPGSAAHGERRTGGASGDPDFGEYAAGTDALVHARFSESDRTKPDDDQPDLARLRLATASHRHFQTIARSIAD